MRLFNQYQNVSVWMYDKLKTYDTQIIQQVILIKKRGQDFPIEAAKGTSDAWDFDLKGVKEVVVHFSDFSMLYKLL